MSLLKPRFVVLALTCLLAGSAMISACSGGEFAKGSADQAGGSSGGSDSGGSGAVGNAPPTGGGTSGQGDACAGPEDCDDKDACTVDLCNADGTCDVAPRCLGTEKCCGGECAECCADADCEDMLECTKNSCFAGKCMYIPDDTACEPTDYCSTSDGCRAKQVCGLMGAATTEECDDGSACTTDRCDGNFCKHDFCAKGVSDVKLGLCCEGGCAEECCTDSQCDDPNDPCQVGSCQGGKCSRVALCADGLECCPSADRQTAACGTCCTADDCDDHVGCTADACQGRQCSHTPRTSPDPQACNPGYLCDPQDPQEPCVKAPDCDSAADCDPSPCQSNARCEDGSCRFDECSMGTTGTKCCDGQGCALCCDDSQCNDNIACTRDTCTADGCEHEPDDMSCGPGKHCDAGRGCIGCTSNAECDDRTACTTDVCNMNTFTCLHSTSCLSGYCEPMTGECVECKQNSDCQGGVITTAAAPPGTTCSVMTCKANKCVASTVTCTGLQHCCPPFGCAIACSIDMTQ